MVHLLDHLLQIYRESGPDAPNDIDAFVHAAKKYLSGHSISPVLAGPGLAANGLGLRFSGGLVVSLGEPADSVSDMDPRLACSIPIMGHNADNAKDMDPRAIGSIPVIGRR